MDKVRVGILGLRRGGTHLRNFLRLDEVEVIGAADRFEQWHERAEEMVEAADAERPEIVQEYDDLLAMEPDAIVVATNGKLQVEHACQALEAGCHVLSEVPGAYTADEWVRLRDTVQRTGRTYMLGENSCFLDFLRYWRKWLLDGEFGPVSLAEGEYVHYLPQSLYTPDGTRLSPSEARDQGRTDARPIWRADQPPIEYLTHDLGPLLEVLDDRCVSVCCRSGPWRCKEAPLRSDGQFALFETAKGALIRILVTLNTKRPGDHRYRIFGVDGGVEWFSDEGYCRASRRDRPEKDGWERVDIGAAAAEDDPTAGHGGTDLKLARCFARTILDERPAPIDVYRAIEYSLPGIIAARSADLGGMPLAIPDLRPEPFAGTTFWDAVPLPATLNAQEAEA
ncbi:Gfo/Idh/MocA family protein [Planctomycetota bacterium]